MKPKQVVPTADVAGIGKCPQPYVDRRWTTSDGLSLYARDYPAAAGPARLPVICLHGLTRNGKDFKDVAPWIAAGGRRVLVPDVRGRGLSDRDPDPDNYRPKTYMKDVRALLDALGIARAIFIGTSMGGIITMILAALRPGCVAAAILNDIGPEIAPEGVARIKSYVGKQAEIRNWDDAVAYVRGIAGPAFPAFDERAWRRFAEQTFREDAHGVPKFDYDPGIYVPLEKGSASAPGFLAWLLFRRLARRPTLLLRGELSDLLSPATAQRMQVRARTLDYVEVPGVGHAPTLAEPEALAALEAFLGRLP